MGSSEQTKERKTKYYLLTTRIAEFDIMAAIVYVVLLYFLLYFLRKRSIECKMVVIFVQSSLLASPTIVIINCKMLCGDSIIIYKSFNHLMEINLYFSFTNIEKKVYI